MIKYVWETNIFNFSRKDVLICHFVLTKRMVLINLGFILTKKILLKSFVKFILCLTFVNCYDNFIFLYIVENVFSSVWEMKREQFCHQTIFFHFARKWISFLDKEHLLLHWASFHTRKYSCYHDRRILILTTISIVVLEPFLIIFSIFSSL